MIYLLCLHGVRTGGPEAIHQLSDALLTQGFEARMVYYTWPEIAVLEQAEPQDGYRFSPRSNGFEDYAHYQVKEAHEIPNAEDVVVVLPETLCHLAPKFNRCKVVVWWLSVDNGLGALSRANMRSLRFSEDGPDLPSHVWQSEYASKFIDALGFENGGELSDYISDFASLCRPVEWEARPRLILINAAKHKAVLNPAEVAEAIRARDPGVEAIVLSGKSKQQLADLYAYARVYIDLNAHPGKDRGPREAASMGCNVLVGDWADPEIEEWAQPTKETIADMVAAAMQSLNARYVYPFSPPKTPAEEKDQFFAEVRKVFSVL